MKILCVGMNYPEHNKELSQSLYTTEPIIFSKPESALLREGAPFFIPDFAQRFDYEAELVVKIERTGKNISERFAHRYYDYVTVGIDFTARDLQETLRAEGRPWELCKAFDGGAALGRMIAKTDLPRGIDDVNFHLDIDDVTVQRGHTREMIHSVDSVIAYCSKYFTLKTGDLIFTGTPVGVGPVSENQQLKAYIEDELVLKMKIK